MDDGPGFSADSLDKIGEPFAKSRSYAARNGGGGLGLGLFIAKTLLERSGAELAFRNREGPTNGADILVEWPRQMMEFKSNNTVNDGPLTKEPSRPISVPSRKRQNIPLPQ
jgi:K+-sensing histidine kinase KdpD